MVLEGQVQDAHTGCPVAEAEVSCIGPGGLFRSRSDGNGYFRFLLLTGGGWQIEINKPPYTERSCRYTMAGNGFLNISLEMDGLDEETVTA